MLAAPPKISAIPIKIVTTHVANPGYAITKPANMSTSMPRPTVAHLPLMGRKIPKIIFSIPTMNKIMPSINTKDTNAAPGCARA